MEGKPALKDDVGLPRDPIATALGMREHGNDWNNWIDWIRCLNWRSAFGWGRRFRGCFRAVLKACQKVGDRARRVWKKPGDRRVWKRGATARWIARLGNGMSARCCDKGNGCGKAKTVDFCPSQRANGVRRWAFRGNASWSMMDQERYPHCVHTIPGDGIVQQ